jgi:simple sugar transport system ATP-binding protein
MAYKLGIGMVHKHFMLVNNLTVLENIILGNEPGRLVIDKKESREMVRALSDQYGFDLDPDAKVSELSVGMKQRVEILKTLYRGAQIIIMMNDCVLTPLRSHNCLKSHDVKKRERPIDFITISL